MLLDLYHSTEYRYAEEVPLSQHRLHLTPRRLPYQRILGQDLEISPTPHFRRETRDYFGNSVIEFSIDEPHRTLHLKSRSRVETIRRPVPPLASTPPWEEAVSAMRLGTEAEPRDFLYFSPYAPLLPGLLEWASESFPPRRPWLLGIRALTARLHAEMSFDSTATQVATPLADVFAGKRGVCQDFAHLQIAALRSLGLAARYVSGYLRTEPPPGQPRRFGVDASHAWISVYCPEIGWIDVDPTNDRFVNHEYVTLGWGRDYGDVSLIRGVLAGGGAHTLYFSVNVEEVTV